jgi:TRAP-type C4-dicarboxylate transport system permease small subunit
MQFLDRVSHYLNQAFIWIAGLFLAAMVLLACANIFLRLVWVPVRGTFELMGYFGAVVTALTLAYTQSKGGHIAVDILVLKFSPKTKRFLLGANNLICLIFFALVAWQVTKYATNLWETGEVTETLGIIYYPFTYGVAAGCAVLCLVFFVDFLKAVFNKKESSK